MGLEEQMEGLKSRLKRGLFDDSLREDSEALWRGLQGVRERDERFYKAKAIVSEVSYYFDNRDLARKSVDDFDGFDIRNQTFGNRRLAREQIRCYLAFVQATLYSDNHYEQAKDKIVGCLDFVEQRLVSKNFRCEGTLAWANYQLGCCLRQLHLLEDAERAFLRSALHQYERAKNRKAEIGRISDSRRREVLAQEEVMFCNRRLAIALGLGIGFCEYTRGRLSSAYQELIIARTLLTYCNDRLNEGYVNLLLGSVLRCRAGSDPSRLEDAEAIVIGAHKAFKAINHRRYTPRATYELALIRLALADRERADDLFYGYLDQATKDADEVLERSRELNDERWISNALVVKSRIERKRKNFPEAIRLATEALGVGANQVLCQIDALIARAESNISSVRRAIETETGAIMDINWQGANVNASRKDLEAALHLNIQFTSARSPESQNEKIEGICWLYLARSHALEGDQDRARAFFEKWKELPAIEHKNINELALKVKAEIDGITKVFHIDSELDEIEYEVQNEALIRFLITVAKQRHPSNQVKRAKLLGVARQTLRNWEERLTYS
jgi:hypothetical protein